MLSASGSWPAPPDPVCPVEAALAALSGEPRWPSNGSRRPPRARTARTRSLAPTTSHAAIVHLAIDDVEAAHRDAVAAVAAEPSGINTPNALAIQVRAALWLGDMGRAREALAGMQASGGVGWRRPPDGGGRDRVPRGPLRSGRGSVCTRTRGMARAGFAARSGHVRSGPRIGSRRRRPCRR